MKRIVVVVLSAAASLFGITPAHATAAVPELGDAWVNRSCVAGGTLVSAQFSAGQPSNRTMTIRYTTTNDPAVKATVYLSAPNTPTVVNNGTTTTTTWTDLPNLPFQVNYTIPRGHTWSLLEEQSYRGGWVFMQDVNVAATSCPAAKSATPTLLQLRTPIRVRHYTVRRHDTLWRIAVRAYGGHEHAGHQWRRIARANHIHGAHIRVGQVLIIPRS